MAKMTSSQNNSKLYSGKTDCVNFWSQDNNIYRNLLKQGGPLENQLVEGQPSLNQLNMKNVNNILVQ